MEWVTTLTNVAQEFVSKDAWDMGLGKIEEARSVLSELGQVPSPFPLSLLSKLSLLKRETFKYIFIYKKKQLLHVSGLLHF